MCVGIISNVPLWITASLVTAITLTYTLYGGLRASIITDNFQFLIMLPRQDREHLGWHQDSHYFYRGLENIFPCVVWTPFNTENMGIAGMIELLEGSHLLGATNHEKNLSSIRKKVNVDKRGAYYIELDKQLKSFKRIKKETISGNSIIMDSDLIHKTGKPNKNIIRFTAIWRYNFSYKK